MGNRLNLYRKGASLIVLVAGVSIFNGCATTSSKNQTTDNFGVPVIESLSVRPSEEQTLIEIRSSRSTHYTAFELIEPPRVILDIRGKPGSTLSKMQEVNAGNITSIHVQEGKTQSLTTRVMIGLAAPLEYQVTATDNIIRLTLTPKKEEAGSQQMATSQQKDVKKEPSGAAMRYSATPSKPRLFFKPRPIGLNQVLGIDFTMLGQGKSRLIVTTDKKVPYQLDQKGAKSLVLTIEESTIPPLLMRRLDSYYFEGVVDRVKATLADSSAYLTITLREAVPFHIKQVDQEILIDFGPTSIRAPEKRIVPLQLAEARVQAPTRRAETRAQPPTLQKPGIDAISTPGAASFYPGFMTKRYTGARMTMDFVNADVTNILRLIAEVSNLNLVWGTEVTGNVSMRLKDVPWDQALDLILANNNLAMRKVGNVVWITTKAQMTKIEAEERRKRSEADAEREKRVEAEKKARESAKQLEPLLIEYIPIDFANISDIRAHLEPLLTDRGKITDDARTNTIILTDIASKIEEAKDIVKQFDTPVKQIMIEARLVDATDTFTRNLGVQWGFAGDGLNIQQRRNTGVAFGLPTDATAFTTGGDSLVGGTFSTNSPPQWASNIGISFGFLSSSALGAITVDARLALAETEGTVKIISAPKVIASNGESATIAKGTTFYLEAAENVEPKEVKAELSLEVTPMVSFNNFVTMQVVVKDEQVTVRGKSGNDITTKLMVKTGETVVIGGIFKETKNDNESGIPYLRGIPGLGWLFKAQSKIVERSELLIFLTPTVLPPPTQAQVR